MYSVLYVDDEKVLLDLCRIFLERGGDFRIETAHSAPEGLKKLQNFPYDAIVSDYQMPDMDGIAFLKEVRSRFGDIPFILFTGKGREDIVIEAINNGADFYLQKGGDPRSQFAELAHKIRKAVERKRAVEELRKNESELRLLKISVDWASDEVFWLDFDGRVLYVNDSACRNSGYSREEFLAMTVFDFDPDFTREMWVRSKIILKESKTHIFTTRHRRKDGTIVDVEIMTNYVAKDGREYSFAFVRNISGRKQAEATLRESEDRYRRLLEQSFDAVIMHQKGMIVSANEAAARLVKAESPTELIGRSVSDFVDPDFSRVVDERMKKIAESPGSAVSLIEERFRCLDGSTVDVEVIATGALFEGQPAVQVVGRDISRRKQTEEALRAANNQLNLLNSITRHDILNKVTIMSGYLELIKHAPHDPKMSSYIAKLETNTKSIREHIEFTKIYQDLGSTEPHWQELTQVLPRDRVPPEVIFKEEIEGISVYADPILKKIFFNLLDNTLRHGKHAKTIWVSARESSDGLTLVWEDDGAGILEREKEKIFGQGYGKNTGLGLFLSRKILSMTGITIGETGEPGKGARFEMNVPKGGYRFSTPKK